MGAFSALLLGVGIVVVFLGLANIMSLDRTLAGRLRHYAVDRSVVADVTSPARRSAAADAMTQQVDKAIAGRSFVAGLRADLAQASLKFTAAEFLVFQAALTFALMLLGYNIIARLSGPNPLAIPLFGLIGFALPKLWLGRRVGARRRAFNDQLPDTVMLMSNALRSGMSLLQSMDMVARESAPPISEEFSRVVREIGFGLAPEEALRHLQQRVQSNDIALLVTGMNVHREVGGNLATLLDGMADAIRERVELKGEIRTLTTQQRITSYVLGFMPVGAAALLLLVRPQYMSGMFNMPYLIMPILAAISVVVGLIVIRKIVNGIEV
jgi:tight adherence protein B